MYQSVETVGDLKFKEAACMLVKTTACLCAILPFHTLICLVPCLNFLKQYIPYRICRVCSSARS